MRVHSRRGGILAGLMLTVVSLIGVAVIIGLVVARNVSVQTVHGRNGDNVSIETPEGHFTIRAHEESGMALVDVPRYPGSWQKRHNGGGAELEWTSNNGRVDRGVTVAGGEMITGDPVGKVVEFYKAQLPSWIIADGKDDDGSFRMEFADGGYKRIIVISAKDDGTHIGVATIGAPAAN